MPVQAPTPVIAVIGAAVVVAGQKYRIRKLGAPGRMELALAGPQWRTNPIELELDLAHVTLRWDPVASVWRVGVL